MPDVLVAFAALAFTPPLAASGLMVDIVPNFVGLGVGSTTDWMGSADHVVGLVPAARVQLGGNRFAELYGPIGDVNVLDIPNWEFGPMLSFRFGRKDVKDPVVNTLDALCLQIAFGGANPRDLSPAEPGSRSQHQATSPLGRRS